MSVRAFLFCIRPAPSTTHVEPPRLKVARQKVPGFPSADLGTVQLGLSREYLRQMELLFFFDQGIKGHNVTWSCSNTWSGWSIALIQAAKCRSVVWSPLSDLENLLLRVDRKSHIVTGLGVPWLSDWTEIRFFFLMGKLQLIIKKKLQWKSGGKFHTLFWINYNPDELNDLEKLYLIPAYLNLNLMRIYIKFKFDWIFFSPQIDHLAEF